MLLPLLTAVLLGTYARREGMAPGAAPPGANSSRLAHEARMRDGGPADASSVGVLGSTPTFVDGTSE
jgi:hypothetical protein